MTDTREPFGKNMQQEPPGELHLRDGGRLCLPSLGMIGIPEGDHTVAVRDDARLRDGDAADVAPQVADNRFGFLKDLPEVDDPLLTIQGVQQRLQGPGIPVPCQAAVHNNISGSHCLPEPG